MMRNIAVALGGLLTSLIVACLDVAISRLTGYDPMSFSLWFVVPVGALLCGFAASSGYYLASRALHQQPTKVLLAVIIISTLATESLVPWIEYRTLIIKGQHVSDFVDFWTYYSLITKSAHFSVMTRGIHSDIGDIGSAGYWIAALDYFAFFLGGLAVFLYLKALPACVSCKKYLRILFRKSSTFPSADSYAIYHGNEFNHPIGSQEFADYVGQRFSATEISNGALQAETAIHSCPSRGDQLIKQKTSSYNEKRKDWVHIPKLDRSISVPSGFNVQPSYEHGAAAPFIKDVSPRRGNRLAQSQ